LIVENHSTGEGQGQHEPVGLIDLTTD